jgi:hypothetical protein
VNCRAVTAGVVALALSACGGRSGALPPASAVTATATKAPPAATGAKLTVVIPHPVSGSTARRPAYVSPSSAQLLVAVNGGSTTTYGLSASSPGCTVVQSNVTCAFQIAAGAGNDAFALTIEDAAGNILSRNVVNAKLAAGVATPVNVTLDGIPASVVAVPGTGSTIEDTATPAYHVPGLLPQSIELEALDADGNVIVGPGSPTIGAPSISQGSAYATIVSKNSTDPNAYLLKATGGSAGGQTVTVSATGQSIPLNDGSQSAPVSSTTNFLFTPAIAVVAGVLVEEYSLETGNEIGQFNVCPGACATTIANAAASDANGDLWVSYVGIAGIQEAYTVEEFASYATSPTLVLSGITGSDGIAVGSNGMVYVANQAAGFFHNRHAASITEYVAGATTPTRTISGAALTGPVAIGVDASGNVYLANSDGTIPVYAAGASTPTTTLSDPSLVQPSAMAVDPAGDLYVFDYANDDIAYFPAGSTSVTQTLTDPSFSNVGGSIALDPAGDLMVCLNNEIEILAAGSLPNAVVVTSYINATGSPAWIP